MLNQKLKKQIWSNSFEIVTEGLNHGGGSCRMETMANWQQRLSSSSAGARSDAPVITHVTPSRAYLNPSSTGFPLARGTWDTGWMTHWRTQRCCSCHSMWASAGYWYDGGLELHRCGCRRRRRRDLRWQRHMHAPLPLQNQISAANLPHGLFLTPRKRGSFSTADLFTPATIAAAATTPLPFSSRCRSIQINERREMKDPCWESKKR